MTTKAIETEADKFAKADAIAKSKVNIVKNAIHSKLVVLNKLKLADRAELTCYTQAELIDKHTIKSSMSVLDITLAIMNDKENFTRSFKENMRDKITVQRAVRRHFDDTVDKMSKRASYMIARLKSASK